MKRQGARVLQMIAFGVAIVTPAARCQAPANSIQNPVLWEDLADLAIIRVGQYYYYSASNMHYSPGAPILRSKDLLHWDYVGHSLPKLDFSPAYNLDGERAYVKGSWASFFGYRPREKQFYWGGCIEFKKTYIYSSPAAEGSWKRKAVLDGCYYDAGLLVDDDDKMYVAFGAGTIKVAQLSSDGKSEVRSEAVFKSPESVGYIEGSRFYKRGNDYYIFVTHPATAEYVLRSTSGPFGPYEIHPFLNDAKSPIAGGGVPHQGGIVQTRGGQWYYMAFIDAFPGGRMPVLAPMKWTADGWPTVELPGNEWKLNYPSPDGAASARDDSPVVFSDRFTKPQLSPEWEWNHNPDDGKWSSGHGLTLQTATVTDDLYMARNTLTHRIRGPQSTATVQLDASGMRDGDRAGLAILRDSSSWIGIERENGAYKLAMNDHITMDEKWQTVEKGMEEASTPVTGTRVWLRVTADIRPGPGRVARFSWSQDGKTYTSLGPPFELGTDWHFFMGYRFAVFHYGTKSLGGEVVVPGFEVTTP